MRARPSDLVLLPIGVVFALAGIVSGIWVLFDHSGGKFWFYWIAPLLTLGFAGVFVPIFLMIGSIGLIASNATSVAMAPFGERAGVASSLLGAMQSAFGVLASAMVGWIGSHGPVPMAAVMFACAAIAFVTYAALVRRAH